MSRLRLLMSRQFWIFEGIKANHMRVFIVICLLAVVPAIGVAQDYATLQAEAEKQAEAYELDAAISTAEKALAAAQKTEGKKSAAAASVLCDLGLYRFLSLDMEAGRAQYEEGLELLNAATKGEGLQYWEAYSYRGDMHYLLEEYEQALGIYAAASTGIKNATSVSSLEFGYATGKAGLCKLSLGQYDEALASFDVQLAIFDAHKKLGTLEHATLLNNIAWAWEMKGDFDKAEPYYKDAVKISRKVGGKTHPEYANNLNNMGMLLNAMGRFDEALEVFTHVRDINEQNFGKQSLEYANSINNLGHTHSQVGNYAQTENLYLEAIAIKKALVGEDHASYIRGLNNIGTVYAEWGRLNEAVEYQQDCVEKMRPRKNDDPLNYADYIQNLASTFVAMGKYSEAQELYNEARQIYLDYVGDPMHWVMAYIHTSQGSLLMDKGDFPAAVKELKRAQLILEHNELTTTPDYITTTYQLGMAYLNAEDYSKAEVELNKAVELGRKHLGKNHPDYSTFLLNRGYLYEKMKQRKKAAADYISALDNYRDILQTRLSFMSADEKSAYWNDIKIGFAFFNHFVSESGGSDAGLLRKMYDYRLVTKSMVINSTLKVRERIMNSGNAELIAQFQQWKSNKEYLNKLYSIPAADLTDATKIEALEAETNQLEKILTQQSADFAGQFGTQQTDWLAVQQALKPGQAAVEIIRAPHYGQNKEKIDVTYLALVLTPETKQQPKLVVLPDGNSMDEAWSDNYFYSIFKKETDNESYTHFWQPIAESLGEAKTVFLSSDGIYNIMNVNTLKNTASGKHVIDELDVRLVTNTGDVVNGTAPPTAPTGPLTAHLFGYPDYYMDLTADLKDYKEENATVLAAAQERQFDREFLLVADLPGTKKEVEAIKTVLDAKGWEANVYLEGEAVEQRIKQLENPTVLHLSTHGFFQWDKQLEKEEKLSMTRDVLVKNPLLRSGIMMAGSGFSLKMVQGDLSLLQNIEDGILTGYEATSLNLDKTELVVLSACLTRVGKTPINDSEGYFGMLRSFMLSGARSVVASSWAVDDRATQELMTQFYTRWGGGEDKHEAFRNAQLEVRKQFPEPYYWGAFIMVGH